MVVERRAEGPGSPSRGLAVPSAKGRDTIGRCNCGSHPSAELEPTRWNRDGAGRAVRVRTAAAREQT
jgi:hypothetical protein